MLGAGRGQAPPLRVFRTALGHFAGDGLVPFVESTPGRGQGPVSIGSDSSRTHSAMEPS